MRPMDTFIEQPIRSLQSMLRVIASDLGEYPQLVPDGIYGPTTMTAISAFQRKKSLPVTGITDENTWDAVVAEYLDASIREKGARPIEIIIDPGRIFVYGDSSPYLYLLQGMLAELSDDHPGIPRPSLNGVMDQQTSSSLKGFQALAGLEETGNADKITWKNLTLQFTLNAHHKEQNLQNF